MTAVSAGVPRTKRIAATLDQVMAFEFPDLVERFERKLSLSHEDAAQLFEDTKRFLYLCAVALEPIAPTPEIDKGWHEFILFTREYAEFCLGNFRAFIHHRPRRSDDPPSNGGEGRRTRALALQVFGTLSSNWGQEWAECSPDTGGGGNECSPEPSCSGEPPET